MKVLFDICLLGLWRSFGALGIVVAGILCGLPPVLAISWMLDGPPPQRAVAASALEVWSGKLLGFCYDPVRGIIATMEGPTGETQVLLAGIERPFCDHRTPAEAMKWLGRNVSTGAILVVYIQQRANALYPMRGHLVYGNLWVNGSLVEMGLAQVTPVDPLKRNNVGRDALSELQNEAQCHQRGFWGYAR